MGKPRVITRAVRMLEDAPKVKIKTDGTVRVMGHDNDMPPWGFYAIIPLTEVEDMVSALARADARETRDDPTKRPRKAKT